jgi:hypothetical protein
LFESVSSNTLIPASVSPSLSVNLKTVMAMALSSGSGSQLLQGRFASKFQQDGQLVNSWSWEFSNTKTSSASWVQICAHRCRMALSQGMTASANSPQPPAQPSLYIVVPLCLPSVVTTDAD